MAVQSIQGYLDKEFADILSSMTDILRAMIEKMMSFQHGNRQTLTV